MTVTAAGLAVDYVAAHGGRVRALDGVDLDLDGAGVVGIVGESGSGKTTLGMALGRLLPPNAACAAGSLVVDGLAVWDATPAELRRLRAERLGFVFQSPQASLDPTTRVGTQLARQLADHGLPAAAADVHDELLRVGLDDVARVAAAFPHELSGGMAQRVAIALALAPSPSLIVADEPTASLDSTIRAVVMRMLVDNARQRGAGVLLLSHDLHTVRAVCDRVVVMYGGRVVEHGPTALVLGTPEHPYTEALLHAIPGVERAGERLVAIDGVPPVLTGSSPGCAFCARCTRRADECATTRPPLVALDGGSRTVLCHATATEVPA